LKQEQAIPSDRRAALVAAEERAATLFDEIERRGLVRAGRTERDAELLQRDGVYFLFDVALGSASRNTGTSASRALAQIR
jgi:hypothetical protein